MTASETRPHWNFSNFNVGDHFEWTHTITAKDVDDFCKLSGDTNPLHLDADFARNLGYKDRVVYGALSMAYVSYIIGVKFPGPGTIWLSQQLRFEAPLYIGDTIFVQVRVRNRNEALRALTLEIEVTKDQTKRAVSGEVVVAPATQGKKSSSGDATGRAVSGEAMVTIPVGTVKLKSKETVAIVTGAGRGIGAAVAESLAGQGIRVVVNYLSNEKAAQETIRKIRDLAGEAIAVQADIGTTEGTQSLFERTIREFGRVDMIVNNAGPHVQKKEFLEISRQDLSHYFDRYVGAAFDLARLATPGMRERSFGRIINILTSSLLGNPPVGWTAYVVAKGALRELSRCLAVELAPWGITCNMVSPALVPTDQWSQLSENQLRAMALRNPARRLTQVKDVAEMVVFLARPESQQINGVNIPVTGGETL